MNKQEILQKVSAIAAEQAGVPVEEVIPATHFVNDLNFDSLDAVEFTMELEDEFDVQVPDEQAENLKTVEAVVDFVVEKLSAGAGA